MSAEKWATCEAAELAKKAVALAAALPSLQPLTMLHAARAYEKLGRSGDSMRELLAAVEITESALANVPGTEDEQQLFYADKTLITSCSGFTRGAASRPPRSNGWSARGPALSSNTSAAFGPPPIAIYCPPKSSKRKKRGPRKWSRSIRKLRDLSEKATEVFVKREASFATMRLPAFVVWGGGGDQSHEYAAPITARRRAGGGCD